MVGRSHFGSALAEGSLMRRSGSTEQLFEPVIGSHRYSRDPGEHRDADTEWQHPRGAEPVFWRQALEELLRAWDDKIQ